jgi:hypothetical protein
MTGKTKRGGPTSRSAPAEVKTINWFGREVVVFDDGRGRGNRSRPRRFTPAVIAKLRRQARTTPVRELARQYGVSRQRIYSLIGPKSPIPREPGTYVGHYTAAEDELVRTLPTAEVVARTGRSPGSVMARRRLLGVTSAPRPYTVEEDLLVMRLSTAEAAARTGRPLASVQGRRSRLGIRVVGGNAGRVQ